MKQLKQVQFEDMANRACRQNNKKVIAENQDEPTIGGNLDEYKEILADSNKIVNAQEFTISGWEHSASHLAAYQILKHFKEALLDKRVSTVVDADN